MAGARVTLTNIAGFGMLCIFVVFLIFFIFFGKFWTLFENFYCFNVLNNL